MFEFTTSFTTFLCYLIVNETEDQKKVLYKSTGSGKYDYFS